MNITQMNLSHLYDCNYILSEMVLTYLIYRYSGRILKELRTKQKFEAFGYVAYFGLSVLLHQVIHSYLLLWGLLLLSYFVLTFLYKGSLLHRILASLLLFATLISVDLALIQLSGHFQLHLYNPPLFSAMAGLLLFDAICLLLYLLFAFIMDIKESSSMNQFNHLALICIPVIILFFLVFTFIADKKDLDFSFYSGVLTMLVLIWAVYFMIDWRTELSKLTFERTLIEQQNAYYKNQLDLLQESSAQTKQTSHDLANHLAVLKALAASGNITQSNAYINRAAQNLKSSEVISASGNPMIDGLINTKLSQCFPYGIALDYEVMIPADLSFDSFDLTIVLGNLLDNALEALHKEDCTDKQLIVRLAMRQNFLTIRVKNTYNGKVRTSQGVYLTSKADRRHHGIGLKNVERITLKYGGLMDIKCDRSWFTVSVALPVR